MFSYSWMHSNSFRFQMLMSLFLSRYHICMHMHAYHIYICNPLILTQDPRSNQTRVHGGGAICIYLCMYVCMGLSFCECLPCFFLRGEGQVEGTPMNPTHFWGPRVHPPAWRLVRLCLASRFAGRRIWVMQSVTAKRTFHGISDAPNSVSGLGFTSGVSWPFVFMLTGQDGCFTAHGA